MELDKIKQVKQENESAKSTSTRNPSGDLNFLCNRVGLGLLRNVEYFALTDQGKKLCDFIVVECDGSVAEFDSKNLSVDDERLYVAVVCYNGEKAENAYLFPACSFKKTGLFSMFGNKNGRASIKMGNKTKLDQYSFGNVVKNIKN